MMISRKTAKTIAPMVHGFALSGVLPKSEADAVERILQDASKPETKSKKEKEKLLTAQEAAKRCGVCSKTILRMRQAGRLKGILVTGSLKSLRFSEREIETLIFNKRNDDE